MKSKPDRTRLTLSPLSFDEAVTDVVRMIPADAKGSAEKPHGKEAKEKHEP